MERLKWRKQSVVARRIVEAFGPDSRAQKLPLEKIWRDSAYHREPLPLAMDQGGRGTKRTRSASSGGGGVGGGGSSASAASERIRNVRSKQTRKKNNLA